VNTAIKINGLPLETLKEMANEAAALVEKHAKNAVAKAIDCGRYLAACKEQVEHGKWLTWIEANFNYTERHAARFMQIAGYAETHSLEQAESIQHALRIIADDPATPKRERKDSPVSVEVVEPESEPDRSPSVLRTTKPVGEKSELPDLPRTNVKHTAQNRKANPAEQPATRPINVEAELLSKTKQLPFDVQEESTSPVVEPELLAAIAKTRDGRHLIDVLGEEDPAQLLEACFRHNPPTAIIRFLINSTADKDVSDVAKQMRKGADMLDPPKKSAKAGSVPTAADLHETIPDEFPEDLHEATKQWASYKQARAKGERVQSQDAWRIALKQIWNHAEANGVDVVIEKIEKAIANSWKGWNHGSGTEQSSHKAQATATQRREQNNASAFDHIRRAAAAQRASGGDQG
jgi:hypothetical protein